MTSVKRKLKKKHQVAGGQSSFKELITQRQQNKEDSELLGQTHLWPQDSDNDSPQLLMLAAELPHLVQAGLELPVRGADAPHHLQVLLPLPLDDVPQQHLELLILVIPRLEDFEAGHHDLQDKWEMACHSPSHPDRTGSQWFPKDHNLLFQTLHKLRASTS